MTDILHKISINAPIDHVYHCLAALDGLTGWWTTTTTGSSAPGKTLSFHFGQHTTQMLVKSLEPNQRVVWQCIDSGSEWTDTQLSFELSEEAGRTKLRFGHRNWREPSDLLAHCSMKWATFLLSLKDLAETGKGRPYPEDLSV